MKAYTLSMLTKLAGTGHPIIDKEIIEWVNTKVITTTMPNYHKLKRLFCHFSSFNFFSNVSKPRFFTWLKAILEWFTISLHY